MTFIPLTFDTVKSRAKIAKAWLEVVKDFNNKDLLTLIFSCFIYNVNKFTLEPHEKKHITDYLATKETVITSEADFKAQRLISTIFKSDAYLVTIYLFDLSTVTNEANINLFTFQALYATWIASVPQAVANEAEYKIIGKAAFKDLVAGTVNGISKEMKHNLGIGHKVFIKLIEDTKGIYGSEYRPFYSHVNMSFMLANFIPEAYVFLVASKHLGWDYFMRFNIATKYFKFEEKTKELEKLVSLINLEKFEEKSEQADSLLEALAIKSSSLSKSVNSKRLRAVHK